MKIIAFVALALIVLLVMKLTEKPERKWAEMPNQDQNGKPLVCNWCGLRPDETKPGEPCPASDQHHRFIPDTYDPETA